MEISVQAGHRAIRKYHEQIADYGKQSEKEGATSPAFMQLLYDTAKVRGWTPAGQDPMKVGGKLIKPDATLRDEWKLPHGYWEAKDTQDNLDTEIRKKFAAGYPQNNIIFEDTRQGILIQNGEEAYRAELGDAEQLARLLTYFYRYSAPNFEHFEQAIGEFQGALPELARGLNERIKQAHKHNKAFQAAFADFFTLCQTSLNPNISRDAVDEMLIQHLLTERLIRRVFNMDDFARRNVIAAEIEKVIGALTGQHFSRAEFLGALDRFYEAIEAAAGDVQDFSEKQKFLNTVYERFFQGYSVKLADTHGIVYTPVEIVEFMVASVEEVLREEFGVGLGDPGVNFLDPATGTGNFIVHLMQRIPKKDLARVYREQMFANEVMLLPYYIAALNIEHEYNELTGKYAAFEGLCFVDTLELAEGAQMRMSFMTAANTERVERQKQAPITVIIGNPPYNMGQVNENDNNKNRAYEIIDERVARTYVRDSQAQLKNKLYDPYIKFFRWATDRLQGKDGIVCFVSNNSFVDQIAFDGMRQHFLKDFTNIYHVDLHGNVRRNPKLSGTTHNVFGIQVGVGITIAIRSARHKTHRVFFNRVPEFWHKEEKLAWLDGKIGGERRSPLQNVKWQRLTPDDRHTWLVPEHADTFAGFLPLSGKDKVVFRLNSLGIVTSRDEWVYDFLASSVEAKMTRHIQNYNYEVFRLSQEIKPPPSVDDFVNNDPAFIKWTDRLKAALDAGQTTKYDPAEIRLALYRPFVRRFVYFDNLLNQRRYQQHRIFPTVESESENRLVCLSNVGNPKEFHCLLTNLIPDYHLTGDSQCFPFYVYGEDGTNRRENITDWALKQFQARYKSKKIDKWDIFYYVYGLLHHPGYRAKYADNLKRELPRIPFAPDFKAFSAAGRQLAEWHLGYEQVEAWPLEWIESADQPLSYRVEKMRLKDTSPPAPLRIHGEGRQAQPYRVAGAVKVNDSLTLAGIPAEAFEYRLGNRSALEWVIDQYRVKTDERSGITSDPNNEDDPEYIVRLVGQVVRVSVETARIVRGLPGDFGG